MLVENVVIGHVLRSLIICQRTYCTLIIKKIESYLAGTYLIYHCEEKELHVQNGLSYCTVQMHHSPNTSSSVFSLLRLRAATAGCRATVASSSAPMCDNTRGW